MIDSPNLDPVSEKYKFLLFVSGMSVKSSHAIENIRKICDQYIPDSSEIEIIDISREKQLAVEYQIIAIPTLIRINPKPIKIILGDLSDTKKVIRILEIEQ